MKLKKNNYLKKLILLIFLLIIVVSCEKENNDSYNQLNHWKVNDVSKNVLNNKTNFDSFIKKLDETKNLKSKTN